jgi:histidinol-phosphate aminotransferase
MSATPDFTRLAARGVRGLEPYVPGKPVEELEREYGVRGALKLASNENPIGPSPRAVAAMAGVLADSAFYPDGSGYSLRHALAARHGVAAGQITLGNGSNDVLVMLAEAFLTPRTEAVHSEYAFLVYDLAIRGTGATARVAPALPPGVESQPYGHDLGAMRALIGPRTRLVFIANPNNPTGTWLEAGALRAFLESVPPTVVVVVDEAYAEYVEGIDYPPTLSWLETFPNLVVTRTFSKIHALAGLRVGYAVSHPQVAELLNRVRQPFNVNSVGQAAALACLEDDEHLLRSRAVNRDGLAVIGRGLAALGVRTVPSVANFVLAELDRPAGPVYERLLRAGVIVRPVANYGLPGHLRISIGTAPQVVRLLEAMEGALRGPVGEDP